MFCVFTVTPELAAALAGRGTRSLTVAVESGSPRVRRIVNKKLEQEEIVACAINAQEGGLEGLKLYGMVGLPSYPAVSYLNVLLLSSLHTLNVFLVPKTVPKKLFVYPQVGVPGEEEEGANGNGLPLFLV